MAKKVPLHQYDKARKCIFCGNPGVTQTDIFPDWLNRLIAADSNRTQIFEQTEGDFLASPTETEIKLKQGSVFSQKPYLACGDCNSGWMNLFEDEMVKFAKPIFLGEKISLTKDQTRTFVGWASLIMILVQYVGGRLRGDQIPIPTGQRTYFMKHRVPPEFWTIIASSLEGVAWRQGHRFHVSGLHVNPQGYERPVIMPGLAHNTYVSSLGLGQLFVQAFVCPIDRFVYDFRFAAKAAGFVQIWPPTYYLWPFVQRLPQFPTKLVLDDEGAEKTTDAFFDRMMVIARRR